MCMQYVYQIIKSFENSFFRTVCDPDVDVKDTICVKAGDNATEVKMGQWHAQF